MKLLLLVAAIYSLIIQQCEQRTTAKNDTIEKAAEPGNETLIKARQKQDTASVNKDYSMARYTIFFDGRQP